MSLSGILHYKFDTDVLGGLKKDNIDNDGWFFDFIHIETYNELERKIIEERLKRRIIPLGLVLIIISILLLPFSPLFGLIQSVEISIITFLSLCFLWEIFISFNYIHMIFEIFSTDLKLLFWQASGEKGFRVSRIIDQMKI